MSPKPVQILSILRMLGLGDTAEGRKGKHCDLKNNLIEVLTGEGKSVTLAIAACLLALLGYDVSVACYSEYMTRRDFADFESLFTRLKVLDRVHYGTFNGLCEASLNAHGDIRRRVTNFVSGVHPDTGVPRTPPCVRRVLLIDEVDVLFKEEFYGELYTAVTTLRHPSIYELGRLIWSNRTKKPAEIFQMVMGGASPCPELEACRAAFPSFPSAVDEACKSMIGQVNDFMYGNPRPESNLVKYKSGDSYTELIVEEYKTMFAYFHFHEENPAQITEESVRNHATILLYSGRFSYAETPRMYDHVMGVTGTLEALSPDEKKIVQSYDILKETFAPSMYEQKRDWNPVAQGHVVIVHEDASDTDDTHLERYFHTLQTMIANHVTSSSAVPHRGAVLVFFEDDATLERFYQCPSMDHLRGQTSKFQENVEMSARKARVSRATTAGQITLLSRTFGRGTDFACFDSEVLAKGGVLVIQTFLSLELSEEIQIRGRCGRQGQPGIYRLVLLSKQLEQCGVTRAEVEEMKKTNIPDYSVLNEARIRKFSERYATNKQALIGATAIHQESMLFLKSLDSFSTDPLSPDNIRKYLLQQNMSTAVFKPSVTRTLVLMDATGSMGSYLHQAKQAVGDMFSRAREILRDHHRDVDCFMIQFAVYRNYNAPLDALFEHSPWTADPNVLRAFMDRMKPAYGISNEAVEVGLAHALEQAAQKDDGGLFQVILIGDVPSNNVTDVARYLTTYRPSWGPNPSGKANWKFVQTPIDHLECLQKLKDQSIPVRAFYVNDYAKTAFMKYATMTAGECHKLSISGPDPAGPLTEAVTCAILRASAGGDVVVANQMTEEYRRR